MDMFSLSLLLVVLWLFVGAYVASAFQEVAEEKGFKNSRKYFWLTFLLGIVGMLLVVALPDRKGKDVGTNQQVDVANDELPDL